LTGSSERQRALTDKQKHADTDIHDPARHRKGSNFERRNTDLQVGQNTIRPERIEASILLRAVSPV
jgi:hypothetical protein